jgi:hypothetical protein
MAQERRRRQWAGDHFLDECGLDRVGRLDQVQMLVHDFIEAGCGFGGEDEVGTGAAFGEESVP